VILSMPKTFRYNIKFAIDNDQFVVEYKMGKKNNKLCLIMRKEDGEKLGITNCATIGHVSSKGTDITPKKPFHVFNIISGKNIFDCKVINEDEGDVQNIEEYIRSIAQNISKTYITINSEWVYDKINPIIRKYYYKEVDRDYVINFMKQFLNQFKLRDYNDKHREIERVDNI